MSAAALTPATEVQGEHDSLLSRLLNPAPRVELVDQRHPQRDRVEGHVTERYQAAFGATVDQFSPFLLTLECLGNISGVAGMRPAQQTPLFLEQYLNAPIEAAISELAGTTIARDAIVEVGNLVAARRGSSHLLFLLFTSALYQAGYEWITFTATRALRNNLENVGFPLHAIAAVDSSMLDAATLQKWGSYYDTAPLVMAGKLEAAMQLIQSRPLLRRVLRHYRPRINELAQTLHGC
jgi:hypothetical protein